MGGVHIVGLGDWGGDADGPMKGAHTERCSVRTEKRQKPRSLRQHCQHSAGLSVDGTVAR